MKAYLVGLFTGVSAVMVMELFTLTLSLVKEIEELQQEEKHESEEEYAEVSAEYEVDVCGHAFEDDDLDVSTAYRMVGK